MGNARRKRLELEEERRTLREGLEQTRVGLAQAYAGFNAVSDPELTDAYLYEILALRARYNYLLRQVKALEDQAPGQAEEEERVRPPRKGWRPLTAYQ